MEFVKRFREQWAAWHRRRLFPESRVLVVIEDNLVQCTWPGKEPAVLSLNHLNKVVIETTDAGPFACDLFWILEDHAGTRLTIPKGATGEDDLVTYLLDLDGYITTFAERTRLMRDWNRFLDQYPLLLTPFLMRPMFDWNYDAGGLDAVTDLFASAVYSTGINYLGLPAGVIGMDLVDDRPAAVQLVGRRFREDLICDALEAIESRNGVLAERLWSERLAITG